MQGYEDLEVFKLAYRLAVKLHQVSLEFPKIEQFGGLADLRCDAPAKAFVPTLLKV